MINLTSKCTCFPLSLWQETSEKSYRCKSVNDIHLTQLVSYFSVTLTCQIMEIYCLEMILFLVLAEYFLSDRPQKSVTNSAGFILWICLLHTMFCQPANGIIQKLGKVYATRLSVLFIQIHTWPYLSSCLVSATWPDHASTSGLILSFAW